MTLAIATRYHGPTAARPSGRITARTTSGRDAISYRYDPALTAQANHITAAKALACTLEIAGPWAGQADSAHGFLFVFLPDALTFTT